MNDEESDSCMLCKKTFNLFFEDIIVVDVVVWFVIDAVRDVYERPRQRVHNERVIDV